MSANEALKLGSNPLQAFDIQTGRYECATNEKDLEKFAGVTEYLRQGSPITSSEEDSLGNRYGFSFRAGIRNGTDTDHTNLMHGVAISRDRDQKVCRVDGVRTNGEDPKARDSMYYLWAGLIIPKFSGERDFWPEFLAVTPRPKPKSRPLQSSEISFGRVTDPATLELLGNFGFQETGNWRVPIPQITVFDTETSIADWITIGSMWDERSTAFVAMGEKGQEIRTHFFLDSQNLGTMNYDARTKTSTLVDSQGDELPVITPDYVDGSLMARLFESGTVRRQLGLVTLQRALLEAE
jgi:hypothetical protein